MKKSYVYIITNGEDLKVGVSYDPEKRLKQLQTGNSKKLRIVSKFEVEKRDVFKMEKEAHAKIIGFYQKRGEWFKGAMEFHVNLILDTIHQKYIKAK
jgi:hypothetical protein